MKRRGVKKPKTYWDDYWKKHRNAILGKRRQRYQEDAEYRNRLRKAREENYKKNRLVKTKRPTVKVVKGAKPVLIQHNGSKVLMYDISYLAAKVGRSVPTVRYWEKRNIIPKTPFVGERKKLYTEEMIQAVYDALADQGFPGNLKAKEFADFVIAKWQALGVA